MSSPTVTAEYETGPRRLRACQIEPPRALVTVEYAHGDHARALDELRLAYEDVRDQIASTVPRFQSDEPCPWGDFTDSARARLDEEPKA